MGKDAIGQSLSPPVSVGVKERKHFGPSQRSFPSRFLELNTCTDRPD